MANTPEALVKKRIRKILEDSHTYFAMPLGTGYGNSGVPDFLVCNQGSFIAIEAKAGKGKTTALQELHLAKIRAAGGVAIVISEANIHELSGLLNGD